MVWKGPPPPVKVYHWAHLWKLDDSGDVSALCYKRPRRIDLRKALWTITPEAVTCKRCLKLLAQRNTDAPSPGGAAHGV